MVWITHSVYVEMCRPSTCRVEEGMRGGERHAGEAGGQGGGCGGGHLLGVGVLVEGGDGRRVREQLAW